MVLLQHAGLARLSGGVRCVFLSFFHLGTAAANECTYRTRRSTYKASHTISISVNPQHTPPRLFMFAVTAYLADWCHRSLAVSQGIDEPDHGFHAESPAPSVSDGTTAGSLSHVEHSKQQERVGSVRFSISILVTMSRGAARRLALSPILIGELEISTQTTALQQPLGKALV